MKEKLNFRKEMALCLFVNKRGLFSITEGSSDFAIIRRVNCRVWQLLATESLSLSMS